MHRATAIQALTASVSFPDTNERAREARVAFNCGFWPNVLIPEQEGSFPFVILINRFQP
jgi:hypothetical protein